MQTQLMTYRDVVDHALDFLGAATDEQSERKARRAVQSAVTGFCSIRNWSIFYRRGRLITNPKYNTGTVAYLNSSGAIPRQLTLTGGTWPTWAGDGNILIGRIVYPVSGRVSNTVLQLASLTAPNENFSSTTYEIAQEAYPLPVDFSSMGELVNMTLSMPMTYQSPGEFIRQQRANIAPAQPWTYTYMGDPRRFGSLSIYFYPPPDQAYVMDYSYRRQSRALYSHGAAPVVSYSAGKVTVPGLTAVVTGSGTLWTPDMVNCVIRFSSGATRPVPTGQAGPAPFYLQRTVAGYTSATELVLDGVVPADLTNVTYSISDPVDLEHGAMANFFLREVEKQCRIINRTEPQKFELQEYQQAMLLAMEADKRNHALTAETTTAPGIRVAAMASGSSIGA